jgi:hypothetical protein
MEKELQRLLEDVLNELKGLVIHLKGSNRALKDSAKNEKEKSLYHKTQIRVIKDLIKKRKESGESYDDLQAELKETTKELDDLGKSAKSSGLGLLSFPKKLAKAALNTATAMGKTALAFTDVSKPITSLSDVVAAGIDEIPGIGKVSMALASDFDTLRESYIQLSRTGATFNGNLLGLSKVAKEASIPLPKLVDLIATNGAVLGAFFGSVQAGADQFISLGRELKNVTERDLAQFGLTTDETAQYMMTFLEAERSRGNLQRFTNTQLVESTKQYTLNLAKLSAMTGKSIDQLNEEQQAANADALFRAKLATMDKETADIITKAYSQMGPGLQQLTKDMLAFEGPVSQIGRDLTVATQGQILGPLQKLLNNAGDSDALRQFQNSVGRIGDNLLRDGQAFADVAILTGDFAGVFEELVPRIRRQISEEGLAGVLEQISESGKAAVNVFSQFDTISTTMQDTRIATTLPATLAASSAIAQKLAEMSVDGGVLDRFGGAVSGATDALYRMMGIEDSTGTRDTRPFMERMFDADPDTPGVQFFNPRGHRKKVVNDQADMTGDQRRALRFATGSDGLQNFGSGTMAILHGMEAVATKDQLAGLANDLLAKGAMIGASSNTLTSGTISQDQKLTGIDMTTLNSNTKELIDLNKKVAQHLNTLVTIGAMTEKNTKNFNNNLANMGGSLV